MPAPLAIVPVGDHPTIAFAAEELRRYLNLATGARPALRRDATGPRIRLGLARDLGVATPGDLGGEDDWLAILPGRDGLTLAGANPRCVLFAVYRYLRALGFRWIRPGARGEVRPAKRVRAPLAVRRRIERPSYRYRTICIEGASSREHVLDLIDWMAKRGMNGYFIQFDYGTYFFKRWYEHRGNQRWPAEPIDAARVHGIVAEVEAALARRGLRFERMGHGWTCAALGLSSEGGWDLDATPVPEDKRELVAMVGGKRDWFGGISLNTNLDYANPAARAAMVAAILGYARTHPQVDLLHVWLADGANNHDERASERPADLYVDLLNEIDAALTAAGLPTRIVFLIYVDLLWPPERARLRNPARFVLMFAPITRSFRKSFFAGRGDGEGMTPFVRNRLVFPKSPTANLAYLRAWQAGFAGDGFDFDYHLIWTCYQDLAHLALARVLHADLRGLAEVGLHGFNSCQNTRMSFPHNLLMDVMAETLWDRRAPFARIARESFADAFGRPGAAVARELAALSRLGEPWVEGVHLPTRQPERIAAGLRALPRMTRHLDRLAALTAKHRRGADGAIAWSWRYLGEYVALMRRLLPAYEAYLRLDPRIERRLETAIEPLRRKERALHPALDVSSLINQLGGYAREVKAALAQTRKS